MVRISDEGTILSIRCAFPHPAPRCHLLTPALSSRLSLSHRGSPRPRSALKWAFKKSFPLSKRRCTVLPLILTKFDPAGAKLLSKSEEVAGASRGESLPGDPGATSRLITRPWVFLQSPGPSAGAVCRLKFLLSYLSCRSEAAPGCWRMKWKSPEQVEGEVSGNQRGFKG